MSNSLIMYRADRTSVTAVECPDGLYPAQDMDGKTIYTNTHFKTPEEAWQRVRANCEAGVELTASDVRRAEADLFNARERAAETLKEYASFLNGYRKFKESQSGTQANA